MALGRRAAVAPVCAVAVVWCSMVTAAAAQESGARAAALRPWLARTLGVHQYEYDERIDLSLDGSAVIDVNASLAALAALRGVKFDLNPEARFDRQQIRQLFEGAGATILEVSAFRRHGRRFAHVRLSLSDIRRASDIVPLSWSHYSLDKRDHEYRFVQDVGPPSAAASRDDLGSAGDELVAFRVHLPSKINWHNSPDRIERGNILVWEQTLRDRLAGAPLHMEARMDTESILYRTLWLFAGTFVSAIAALGIVVWWVGRKGRSMVPA